MQELTKKKKQGKFKHKEHTDEVWYVEAIRKPAGWSASRVIDPIRVRVCPSSGNQVVIVATVHQGISENEECPCLGYTTSTSDHQDQNSPRSQHCICVHDENGCKKFQNQFFLAHWLIPLVSEVNEV